MSACTSSLINNAIVRLGPAPLAPFLGPRGGRETTPAEPSNDGGMIPGADWSMGLLQRGPASQELEQEVGDGSGGGMARPVYRPPWSSGRPGAFGHPSSKLPLPRQILQQAVIRPGHCLEELFSRGRPGHVFAHGNYPLSVAATECKVSHRWSARNEHLALAYGRICRVHAVQRLWRGRRAAACRQPERGSIGCSESEFNRPIRGGFDIRNPSATNPPAAASQIPQPAPGIAPRRTNLSPVLVDERVRVPPRRARKAQVTKRRAKSLGDGNEQMTRPFEALEGARRDRIETEKRDAQEKAKEARLARGQKAKEEGGGKARSCPKSRKQPGGKRTRRANEIQLAGR